MSSLIFITHPEVDVVPSVPITKWGLSAKGRTCAERFARSRVLSMVTSIWSSDEQKALETSKYLSRHLGCPVHSDTRLGENDRSATGYLPPEIFELAADKFFADAERSFKGWERAIDAQARIEHAVREHAAQHHNGDIAVVSHGAVGTLLYCALAHLPIDRKYDQPGQGHYWTASLRDLVPHHGWLPMG